MIGSGSDLIRQREPNMDLDGGLMFMFTFSGSDDEHPSGQTEHHGVALEYKASLQATELTLPSSSVIDNEPTPPSDSMEDDSVRQKIQRVRYPVTFQRLWIRVIRLRASHGQKADRSSPLTVGCGGTYLNENAHGRQG